MNKTNILNFSLGPVQGFIARARKTRDFWTGSFLLSYLAGQAMAEILEQGKLNSARSCGKQNKLLTRFYGQSWSATVEKAKNSTCRQLQTDRHFTKPVSCRIGRF